VNPKRKEWPYLPGLAPVPKSVVLEVHASKAIWNLVKRNRSMELRDDEASVDLYVLDPQKKHWGQSCTFLRVAKYREPRPACPDGGHWLGDIAGHGPGPSWECIGCCFMEADAPATNVLRFGGPGGRSTEFRVSAHFHTSSRSEGEQKAKKDLHSANHHAIL